MPFAPGTRLGPYEVVALLGAGGMGEVYRARDTRLGRMIAIKVLSEKFSQNADLRQRLELEARTISSLSHPNICTLHDIGHQEGVDFLVLEFVEGQTLRELLASGALPVPRVISIAVQIAEGLTKAHEAGIVHRDLKPENVIISAHGVKILDFGLAKMAADETELDNSDTVTTAQASSNGISGTAQYMSPEQASALPLDFRSDQFSFGVVLYELTTGRHPFRKPAQAQTLLAILQEQPKPISSLNPEVPPPLCWLIERCLSKEPEKRYASTQDLLRDLTAIRDRVSDLNSRRQETRSSNLPAHSTPFVGRAREQAALSQLLLRQDARLITVTGPGGIGKSRLAVEVARDLGTHFTGGIYFVPLASVRDQSSIVLSIVQAIGLRESAGLSPMENLKAHLSAVRSAEVLLVIDNFEHLVASAPILSELLAAAPSLKLVVTSRAALHVYDEHEFPVPPLGLPDPRVASSLQALGQCAAVALFVQRAAAVKPDFELTEENGPVVAEICTRLDGLPLAIELAAARVKLLPLSAMRARLASSLQLLTGGARDLPARQRTLRQAIDWSYDLLTEAEQKLFRRLSVFRSGCTLEAAESVCDTKQDLGIDLLDGMSSMVDKSLVRQTEQADGEPRFVMLETLREYGLLKLAEVGEESATRRAHAAYCLVVAEEGAAQDGANLAAWLDRFELEHDNFRAALEYLIESGNAEWGLRLGVALFRFWEMREHLSEGREWLGRVLKLKSAPTQNELRVRALFAAGVLTGEQADYSGATTLIEGSLELARQVADARSIAIALNALAVNMRDRGEVRKARELFEEALGLFREQGDAMATARALSNLANVVKMQGDFALAGVLYQECRAIFRQAGDKAGYAWALNHQGDAARAQADYVEARALYQESLEAFRDLNDRWGIAACLADLGNLATEEGDHSGAEELYRESLAIFKELEHKRGIARVLEAFACSAAAQSVSERSLRLAGAAAALRQSIGAPPIPSEQAKLEQSLERARQGLTEETERSAWLQGWVMPIEQVVDELLKLRTDSGTTVARQAGLKPRSGSGSRAGSGSHSA